MSSKITPPVKTNNSEWQDWLQVVSSFLKTGELCNLTTKADDNRYYGKIKILNKEFTSLLDTGATSSVISKALCNKLINLGFTPQLVPEMNLSTADGTNHLINSAIYLPVEFMGQYKVIYFSIVDNLKHDLLFGMNFLQAFDLSIGHAKEMLNLVNLGNNTEINIEALNDGAAVISRDELTDDQNRELNDLIDEMRATIGTGLGKTNIIEHKIDTGDNEPVNT